jgi:uncharacterized protein (TIGR02246 family)
MRRHPTALVLLAAVAACTAKKSDTVDSTTPPAAVAAPNVANTKADEDSIRAIGKRWNAMVVSKDTAGMGALFADDGAEFSPNTPVAKGPAAVTADFGAMFRIAKDFTLTFQPTDVTVSSAGDVAVERGTYQDSWTDPKGKKIADHGNYVTAWKKVNGQWKVYADMNASEVAPPGM